MDQYQNIGPGSYKIQDDFEANQKRAEKMKNKDKLFGLSKRDNSGEAGKSLPGPGHYAQGTTTGEMNEWYKKTFNYRYLKQYHVGGEDSLQVAKNGHPRAKSHLNSMF